MTASSNAGRELCSGAGKRVKKFCYTRCRHCKARLEPHGRFAAAVKLSAYRFVAGLSSVKDTCTKAPCMAKVAKEYTALCDPET